MEQRLIEMEQREEDRWKVIHGFFRILIWSAPLGFFSYVFSTSSSLVNPSVTGLLMYLVGSVMTFALVELAKEE